ncbi:MAG: hypothetical protein AAF383_16300 [Cyanobacteria bacterium P01_A01_bin.83]
MKLTTIATLSAIALSNLGTAALADKVDQVASPCPPVSLSPRQPKKTN